MQGQGPPPIPLHPSQQMSHPPQQQLLLSRAKLHELLASVQPDERLDPAVELALVKMAESFVVEVSSHAAEFARHRSSRVVEPKDIQLYLEREYDMGLPGFVDGDERTALRRGTHPTVGHQTRAAHAARAASTTMAYQQGGTGQFHQAPHQANHHHHNHH